MKTNLTDAIMFLLIFCKRDSIKKEVIRTILFCLVLLFPFHSFGQIILYEKMHGVPNRGQFAYDIIETTDGNFLLCGISAINSPWGFDGKIMKVNQNGDTLWTKTLYASTYNNSNDLLLSIAPNGNNYVFAGGGFVNNQQKQDAWLLEYSLNGTKTKEVKFGGTQNDIINKIVPLSSGGFIAVGNTKSFGTQIGGADMWIIRLNNNLDTLWTKTIDMGYIDDASGIIPFQNDKFLIIGNSCVANCNALFNYEINAHILVTDTLGNLLSDKTFSSGKKNIFSAIAATNDGGAIITGGINTAANHPNIQLWAVKLNANTDTVWTKRYGLANRYNGGNSIFQQADGNYIIGAYTQTYCDQINTDYDDPWVLKLNSNGDTLWTLHMGGMENDGIKKIISANDGTLVFAGYYDLPSDTLVIMVPSKFYIGKVIDTLLSSTPAVHSIFEINLFPNPLSTQTTLTANQNLSNATLTVSNIFGQTVKEIKNISGQAVTLSRNNLSSGIYFIRLTQDNKIIATKKIIITD